MTDGRPSIDPGLAAALTTAVPARLLKKLDAEPRMAEAWRWAADAVTTASGETVGLAVERGVVVGVQCSCLLAPRCLHVAAVVAALPAADASDDGSTTNAPDPATTAPDPATTAPDPATTAPASRRSPTSRPSRTPGARGAAAKALTSAAAAVEAAALAARVLEAILAAGAEATGAFAQGELLRAIHACRSEGLHRLAASQTRVLRAIRELRADRPEFALGVLTADLREALTVAHALTTGATDAALRGTARRDYEPVGSLHLRGVFTEAVIARSGYAGAITYLTDDTGALYTRADVAPGDASRAVAAYDAAAGIGEAVLPHRELCRAGLFVEQATASADGRLGGGQRVRAVRASEPSRWDQPPLDARFRVPLAAQLAQIAARDGEPDELRPAGWNLVFLDGELVRAGTGLALVVARGDDLGADVALALEVAHDERLAGRDNLIALAEAAPLAVRAIGRVRIAAARELRLLAIGAVPGASRLMLMAPWQGRANMDYDRVAALPPADDAEGELLAPAAAAATPPADDLLAPLRRRVERVVLGGSATLPTHALLDLAREASALTERALGGAAEVLRDLGAAAHGTGRGATGSRAGLDRAAFAYAWLRAAVYEDAARRRLSIARW